MNAPQTIYALASAPGRAGVAVFRLSGSGVLQALAALGVARTLTPREATLVRLLAPATCRLPSATPIDHALALYFPAPHSFTGEDVLELHTHGSRAVTRLLLEALSYIPGLRLAEPGEFARRAFMHGKLDLLQAEGLADLIDAQSASQHAQAMRQLGGAATARIEALRAAILEPLALMEAYIDFPDEEIPEAVLAQARAQIIALRTELVTLLDDRGVGEKIREGLEVVIVGAPNAGKSSLLNALARREAAIVSPEAGTTRDLIEVSMEIAGYAVTLVDTAGIREAAGAIEAEGIRRALARAENADLTLRLFDGVTISESLSEIEALNGDSSLCLITKSDLASLSSLPPHALAISTKTGAGMEVFLAQLQERIAARMDLVASPLITQARHREAIKAAHAALARFDPHAPLELACEELRLAASAIGKITGKIWADDVLGLVFSRFCIGK